MEEGQTLGLPLSPLPNRLLFSGNTSCPSSGGPAAFWLASGLQGEADGRRLAFPFKSILHPPPPSERQHQAVWVPESRERAGSSRYCLARGFPSLCGICSSLSTLTISAVRPSPAWQDRPLPGKGVKPEVGRDGRGFRGGAGASIEEGGVLAMSGRLSGPGPGSRDRLGCVIHRRRGGRVGENIQVPP